MWKLLYSWASPKLFYHRAGQYYPWLLRLAFSAIAVGMVWGLFFVPADYQQGDAFRMIYVHVPCAFLSLSLYVVLAFLSVLIWVWRIKLAGVMLILCAEMGLMMTALALVTGSIWGKPMWGTWWVWDARLTSELVLFLLYAAIVAMYYAYEHHDRAERLVAILVLIGLIDLPIIHYSVIWWNTLHQGPTLLVFAKSRMHSSMLPPLFFMGSGLGFYCLGVMFMRAQSLVLWRERRQQWVQGLICEGKDKCVRC